MVDDLLYAILGLDGQYARARLVDRDSGGGIAGGSGRRLTYVLEGHIDPSLHDLASRILPMWCVPGKARALAICGVLNPFLPPSLAATIRVVITHTITSGGARVSTYHLCSLKPSRVAAQAHKYFPNTHDLHLQQPYLLTQYPSTRAMRNVDGSGAALLGDAVGV